MFKLLFVLIIIAVIVNYNNKKTLSQVREATGTTSASTSCSFKEEYNKKSNLQKSEMYFNHRIDMVLKGKYPDLITWETVRSGISLKNQAIEVIVFFPENVKKHIWLTSNELIGRFNITKEEVPEEIERYDTEPDDEIREFLIKYAGIIDRKVSFAVEKKLNYAYFEFRDGETKDFMQKVCDRLTTTLDGVMCQLNLKESKLELNVQNMLDE